MKFKTKSSPEALKFKISVEQLAKIRKVGKTGWFKEARYEDGTPVAEVAARNEYGDGKVPPRSFMRTTIAEKEIEWKTTAAQLAKQCLKGDIPPENILKGTAALAAGQIRKKITQIFEPPLSPRTIAARKSKRKNGKVTESLTKPLIDSGVMLNTLTSHVEDK